MRSSRAAKKRNRKTYIKNILLTFLIVIPSLAIISSMALHFAVSKDGNADDVTAIFKPKNQDVQAFKYNFDINAKQLYRVEIKKFDKYEEAEDQIKALKNKKLNGFIIKEQGYLAAYGIFINQSQADTAVKYLKRKKIESTVEVINISGLNIKYDDMDKNLIDLASAADSAILSIMNEKSALSVESLYSDKEISGKGLEAIVEQEEKLMKYLNYLKDIKTSKANEEFKKSLEGLINEVLVDKVQAEGSYDYYSLQNSLMNQGEALKKFYGRLTV